MAQINYQMGGVCSNDRVEGESLQQGREVESEKSALRIGWELPAHLFRPETGECLCGSPRDRGELAPEEVQTYTSELGYPLGRLGSVEEVVEFANGICGNCLRSYYSEYRDQEPTTRLDVYASEIQESENDTEIGFCRQCGSPVDVDRSGGAYVNGEYYAHKCVECTERILDGVVENFRALTKRRQQR